MKLENRETKRLSQRANKARRRAVRVLRPHHYLLHFQADKIWDEERRFVAALNLLVFLRRRCSSSRCGQCEKKDSTREQAAPTPYLVVLHRVNLVCCDAVHHDRRSLVEQRDEVVSSVIAQSAEKYVAAHRVLDRLILFLTKPGPVRLLWGSIRR